MSAVINELRADNTQFMDHFIADLLPKIYALARCAKYRGKNRLAFEVHPTNGLYICRVGDDWLGGITAPFMDKLADKLCKEGFKVDRGNGSNYAIITW
jgi:hypothetical protein